MLQKSPLVSFCLEKHVLSFDFRFPHQLQHPFTAVLNLGGFRIVVAWCALLLAGQPGATTQSGQLISTPNLRGLWKMFGFISLKGDVLIFPLTFCPKIGSLKGWGPVKVKQHQSGGVWGISGWHGANKCFRTWNPQLSPVKTSTTYKWQGYFIIWTTKLSLVKNFRIWGLCWWLYKIFSKKDICSGLSWLTFFA